MADYLQFPQAFPERDLSFPVGGRPEWKMEWDAGRRLVRSGDLRGAVECYQRLLAAKGNVEEARWELVMLLARSEDWERARGELELLVEIAPDNVLYLNALGVTLRHTGQFDRALALFGKVRDRFPDNLTALAGQTQGLLEAGRKKEALPLFQEVVARNPEDRGLALALATMAHEQGQPEVARKLLVALAGAKKVEIETLVFAARLHDGMGKDKEAAGYWEKVLLMDQAHREAHGWLARYQESQGRLDKALPHLQVLLEQEPQNVAVLGRICRIYSDVDGRFSEALPYYEKYIRLRPDDLDFIGVILNRAIGHEEELVAISKVLLAVSPDDLGMFHRLTTAWVAAGNAERAQDAWERLARIIPERVEVYRALAQLLEDGREERLVVVLESIHRLAPDDQAVIGRLARLAVARGDLDGGLAYYNQLELAGYGGSDLHAGRAALYEKLGQPSRALSDYKKLLSQSPVADETLRRALFLAGEHGDVTFLIRMAGELEKSYPAKASADEMLPLAEAFAAARDFDRAARSYRSLVAGPAGNGGSGAPPALSRRARLELAQLYRREGLPFEAEQVLREGLLVEAEPGEFLARLIELALTGGQPDLPSARAWLDQYRKLLGAEAAPVAILQARLLAAAGERRPAEEILRRLLAELEAGDGSRVAKGSGPLIRQIGVLSAEILLADGDLAAAEQQCLAVPGAASDLEVLALLQAIYLRAGERAAAANVLKGMLAPAGDAGRLSRIAELLAQRGLFEAQREVAGQALRDWPDSLRAGLLQAEALAGEGKIAEALRQGGVLAETFPGNLSVAVFNARLNFQAGQYCEVVRLGQAVLAAAPDRFDIRLLMARGEMALGERAEAERLAREGFPESGARLLSKRLADAGLPLAEPRARTFWQIMTLSRPPFDPADEMSKAEAFVDQSLPERRGVNELVTALFVPLRWERSFRAALSDGR